jgi:uncharacterized protein YdcH (DUF465 family)
MAPVFAARPIMASSSREKSDKAEHPHEWQKSFQNILKDAHLCASDAHFSKLFEEYHMVNRAVHTAETDVKPTSDDHILSRKERMRLKDQVHAYLTKSSQWVCFKT